MAASSIHACGHNFQFPSFAADMCGVAVHGGFLVSTDRLLSSEYKGAVSGVIFIAWLFHRLQLASHYREQISPHRSNIFQSYLIVKPSQLCSQDQNCGATFLSSSFELRLHSWDEDEDVLKADGRPRPKSRFYAAQREKNHSVLVFQLVCYLCAVTTHYLHGDYSTQQQRAASLMSPPHSAVIHLLFTLRAPPPPTATSVCQAEACGERD
ncbi:hypothetical protein Q8A73_015573 [Channa argus]|nr:hypothetical protein Q8A73_015573 [Channa argus]